MVSEGCQSPGTHTNDTQDSGVERTATDAPIFLAVSSTPHQIDIRVSFCIVIEAPANEWIQRFLRAMDNLQKMQNNADIPAQGNHS